MGPELSGLERRGERRCSSGESKGKHVKWSRLAKNVNQQTVGLY
jgi:hypothetical protein